MPSHFTTQLAQQDAAGFYQATLDSLPARVVVIDAAGQVVAVNAAWTVFGTAHGGNVGAVGSNYLELCETTATPEATEVATGLREIISGERDELAVEYSCSTPEGERWFVVRAARFAGTGPAQVVMQHQDVTDRRTSEGAARFRSGLLDAVNAAVIALDPDGVVTAWNRGAEALYGFTAAEVAGARIRDLIVPQDSEPGAAEAAASLQADGHWEGEMELRRKDGSLFPGYVRNTLLDGEDGRPGMVGISVDHSADLQAALDLRSARDYMRAVADSMGEGLLTLDEEGRVVYTNPRAATLLGWTAEEMDGKCVHEAIHHTRGDGSPYPGEDSPLVLARRERRAVRVEDDVLIRRDGSHLPVAIVQTPFETDSGVGGFVYMFTDMTGRKTRERDAEQKLSDLFWIERIRDAMANDGFVLHAQPIIDLKTGKTVQHELLIRMLDDDGGIILPGEFLPVAENYGLVGEIDRWVIHQGILLAAEGHAVELNLSADSLSDPGLFYYVDAELRRVDADPSLIVFELTETALLSDEEAALAFVTLISERGCGLALDDFGTGYGSFSYLKRLPVDYLKIDIEFVRDLRTDPASRQVVDAVVNLARGFGLKTVAEGVEELEVLALLEAFGVDYAQGYAIGRPAPIQDTMKAHERSVK